LLKEATKLARR